MDDTCANPSWTVLIVYKCVSRALWASCVYTFTALSESVFSEAFLVGMDDGVPTFMDFSGIARSVFLDLIAINPSCCRFIKVAKFCEFDRRENEAENLFVASIRPLIDPA